MRKFLAVLLSLSFILPLPAFAADQAAILQKMEALSKELDRLKQQMQEMQQKETAKEKRITVVEKKAEEAAGPSWLEIGGDYRFRMDNLKGKTHDANVQGTGVSGRYLTNDTLLTNRFGLNFKADATEDIEVKARLLMYKLWGMDRADSVTNSGNGSNGFFADKNSIFDANIGHTPQDNTLRVDQVYVTWTDIGGAPVWLSVGRRPSTGGVPTNMRQNLEKVGTAGVPGFLVDWAFDGATLGYAPDINALPGAYAKLCYGKGFESGLRANNGLKDTDMLGLNVVPYDTNNLHFELQWNRAFNIMASATDVRGSANTNVGDVDQYGAIVMGKIDSVGPGDLNLFLAGAMSKTKPNTNKYNSTWGLLWDDYEGKKGRTGNVIYLGGRYDIKSTLTKIGVEYNHGSKNWLAFAPASDDMWTTKLGTRGDVYEVYIIQELNKKPISKRGKAFFRLGFQLYDFTYTGSQNWLGAPYRINDLTRTGPGTMQMFQPVKTAKDIYLTFDVLF